MTKTFVVAVLAAVVLTGCGSGADDEVKSDPAAYNKCLETEAAKFFTDSSSRDRRC